MPCVRQSNTCAPAAGLWRLPVLLLCFWYGAGSSVYEQANDAEEPYAHDADTLSDRVEVAVSSGGSLGKGRMMRAERVQDRLQTGSEDLAGPDAVSLRRRHFGALMPEEDPTEHVQHAALTEVIEVSGNAPAVATPAPSAANRSSDCQWYDWSPWSYCSQSCGTGWRSRKRTVSVEKPGSDHCSGTQEDLAKCNDFECPIDCGWGVWSDWSHCTASCNSGTRQRGRPIQVQNNSRGKPCNFGDGIEIEDCATAPCARDCRWSDWSVWAACSESCGGGVTTRSRFIQEPSLAGGTKCEGATRDEEVCNLKTCPKDCVLSDWSAWGPCSATCGNGTSSRKRSVVQEAEGGGTPCRDFPFTLENRCFVQVCASDCVWADWSEWSWCPVTCGGNSSHSVFSRRARAKEAQAGGEACQGENSREKPCGESDCPTPCKWGNWGEWLPCTKTCGGGRSERIREVTVPATNGGEECLGSSQDMAPCSLALCPLDCKLSDWEEWSTCSKPCGNGTALRWRHEVSPAARGGKPCPEHLRESGPCTSNDCVLATDLIRDGLAHQVTGQMQIITEDPVAFAGNPFIEEVSRQAIAAYAGLPVTRVHVSMIPHVFGDPKKSKEVNCWYSMLVPNTTNLTAVLDQFASKDLVQAGKFLRSRLHQAGSHVIVNISKLYVNRNENSPPLPIVNETELREPVAHVRATTTEPPTPNGSHPNATRVTGVMKMLVSQPLKFAEDTKTTTAAQKVLAELSGVPLGGVHASLIPDQVYNYAQFESNLKNGQAPKPESFAAMMIQVGADGPNYPSDSIRNASGDVDGWFSLIGRVQKDRQTAIQEGRNIAKAMMAEDLKEVTVRLLAYLNESGLGDMDAQVIQIIAKADGDIGTDPEPVEEEDPLEEPQSQLVTGVIEMITKQPKILAADHRTEEGLLTALSQLADMPEERIRVATMPSTRLANSESLMARPSIEDGEVPPKAPVNSELGWHDEISAWFRIMVPAQPLEPNSTVRADSLAAKLRSQDLTVAGLKVQNCFMDLGLDTIVSVGRITSFVYSAVTTTTPPPGGVQKVKDLIEGEEHLDGISNAMQTVLDSSIVHNDNMAPPSKVVAVVAKVQNDLLEPPTMSNPGGGDEEDDDQLGGGLPSLVETGVKPVAPGMLLEGEVKSAAMVQTVSIVMLVLPILSASLRGGSIR